MEVPPQALANLANRKAKGTYGDGLRYEKQVLAKLDKEYDEELIIGPWLKFYDENGDGWCQPDALHFDILKGVLTVFEVKLSRTYDAWWQLRGLYAPLLAKAYPDFEVKVVKVVKNWYPGFWPEPFVLAIDMGEVASLPPDEFIILVQK